MIINIYVVSVVIRIHIMNNEQLREVNQFYFVAQANTQM